MARASGTGPRASSEPTFEECKRRYASIATSLTDTMDYCHGYLVGQDNVLIYGPYAFGKLTNAKPKAAPTSMWQLSKPFVTDNSLTPPMPQMRFPFISFVQKLAEDTALEGTDENASIVSPSKFAIILFVAYLDSATGQALIKQHKGMKPIPTFEGAVRETVAYSKEEGGITINGLNKTGRKPSEIIGELGGYEAAVAYYRYKLPELGLIPKRGRTAKPKEDEAAKEEDEKKKAEATEKEAEAVREHVRQSRGHFGNGTMTADLKKAGNFPDLDKEDWLSDAKVRGTYSVAIISRQPLTDEQKVRLQTDPDYKVPERFVVVDVKRIGDTPEAIKAMQTLFDIKVEDAK